MAAGTRYLIVRRGGVPWVLGKAAGCSWAGGFHWLSMGLPHCSKSLFIPVCSYTPLWFLNGVPEMESLCGSLNLSR